MKIEDLEKYPKLIDDHLFEFKVKNPIGTIDLLKRVNSLSNTGQLVGSGINKLRKRYSSIISINKRSYWALTLFSRYARKGKKKNYSVPMMIDILINNMRDDISNPFLSPKNMEAAEVDNAFLTYEELNSYFKRVYIYEVEGEKSSEEVFLPDLTYHEIPLLREYLLALVEPELFDYSNHLWDKDSLFSKMDFVWRDSLDPEEIDSWIRSDDLDLFREIDREVENSKSIEQFEKEGGIDPNEGKEIREAKRKVLDNMKAFMHLEEEDKKIFIHRFNVLKEFSSKLGTHL